MNPDKGQLTMTIHQEISNSDDVIDSRDVIARIEELEDMVHDESATEDDQAELAILQALAKEGGQYAPDWEHGETLIRDSYFIEYAQELADDIGAISRDATWPNNFIDWEAAADALKQDYTSIDFDGVSYWIR
jgi:hypothetical protein